MRLRLDLLLRRMRSKSEELRELRPALLAYAAQTEEDGRLRAEARVLSRAWLTDRKAVPATIASAVLDTAARYADAPTYQRLERAALASEDLRERHELLAALAKTREPKLRERALSLTLEPDLSGRDARDLIDNALWDDANRRAA